MKVTRWDRDARGFVLDEGVSVLWGDQGYCRVYKLPTLPQCSQRALGSSPACALNGLRDGSHVCPL